jgi:hypothetical protein
MVYSSKFVMSVLIDGHPQRELANGVVKVKFGEYVLRFRNKNNRRALVTISIDGENVSAGGYIIPANSYIDIERWADKPVKFKFVSLDSEEAVDFGKNGPNEDKVKGTIEARFHLEKEVPQPLVWPIEHHHHHYPRPVYPNPIWTTSGGPTYWNSNVTSSNCCDDGVKTWRLTGAGAQSNQACGQSASADYCGSVQMPAAAPVVDGCTVEGDYSNQSFRTVYFDAETDYVALKLFLQGFDEDVVVAQPKHRETAKSRKLRELEEENRRLKDQVQYKEHQDAEAEAIRKLEEENKKLRDKTLIC